MFLRMVVEHLRMAAGAHDLQSLSIVGGEELDEGPLSVDTHLVRAWLDDPRAYPGPWRHNEFPITFPSKDEVMVRLRCASLITAPLRDELERIFALWLNAVAHIVDDGGFEIDLARDSTFPTIGRAKHEMRALYPRFAHDFNPSLALLSNMLLRFHHDHAKLTELELGAPW